MLDPSGSYLPTIRGRERTCLFRKISDISRYVSSTSSEIDCGIPSVDILIRLRLFKDYFTSLPSRTIKGYVPIFPFFNESMFIQTIFRLPLKAGVDIHNLMNGAYLKLAENALFFTCLHEISAWICPPSGKPYPMWQIRGNRSNLNLPLTEQDVFSAHELDLTVSMLGGADVQQHWTISKLTQPVSALPADCIPALQTLKIDRSAVGLTICLAFCRRARETMPSSLFSGLQLPERISLPLHLNAPFSLASDRRNIRLDPPDANGQRTYQSVYNYWVLHDLVPCLYLRSLAYAYERYGPALSSEQLLDWQPSWWPHNLVDEVSRIVGQGFYSLLPYSSERVFRSVDGELLSSREAVFSDKEPYRITSLLKFMKTKSTVVLPHGVRSLILQNDAYSTFQRVSADFLIKAIQQSPKKFLTFVEKGFVNPALDLDSVTVFILSGCTAIPWDLPLLFTEARSCVPLPTIQQPPLYFHSLDKVPSIFPVSRFLHHEFQKSTVVLLQEKDVNIRPFDFAAVESLVVERLGSRENPAFRHSEEDAEWIRQFWQFCAQSKLVLNHLVGSVISKLPLLETYDGVHVSLAHCVQSIGNVLPDPAASDYDLDGARVAKFMGNMGVHVLQKPPPLLSKHIPNFSLNVVLACMRSQVPADSISSLSESDHNEFARWVRSQLQYQTRGPDNMSPDSEQTLFQLPIWPAQRERLDCLVSSRDLKMLPSGISVSDVTTFLKPEVPVAKYSPALHHKCGKVAIDLDELLSLVEVPDILPLSDLQRFRSFLNTILHWPAQLHSNRVSAPLRVPNNGRSMILVRNLYDSNVDIFSQALESSRFPHSDFRSLQHDLRSWGLRHELDYDSFYECANTIDQDVRHNRNQDSIVDRARTVYHCYNHTLPLLRNGALSAQQWSRLNNLCFIPRNTTRRHTATYETSNYGSPLPDILSPAQIVREEYEAVAWTQRGLIESDFESRPSRPLLTKNSSFGVPSADEVVRDILID